MNGVRQRKANSRATLVEYYSKHQVIEKVTRDFNANFCTEIDMPTISTRAGENHNDPYVLRHTIPTRDDRAGRGSRLDTVKRYHLGEMTNKR